MYGESTTVAFSSGLEPQARSFDLATDVTADIPENVRRLLARNPLLADLWATAVTCFAVDQSLKRPPARAWRQGKEWVRHIRVEVPVRNPRWWTEHIHLVEKLLAWLTADHWSLRFHQDPRPQSAGAEPLITPERIVALFSGGLDSVCGVIQDAGTRKGPFRLVSVSTNSRMKNLQQWVVDELNASRPVFGFSSFRLHLHVPTRESTARTRGFVFLTAGVATAIAEGLRELRLYENGPGALNLALSHGQVGTQAARAVHPKTLRYMEELASAVLGGDRFTIVNPCFAMTKAEMVAGVPEGYDPVLEATISCDTGFSHHGGPRGASHPHCGGCTSCVLRRQALAAAESSVTTPLRGTPQRKAEHRDLMAWQVARLRHAMREGLSWKRMVREFPDLVCDPESFRAERREELLNLFSRYAAEWDLPAVTAEFAVQGSEPLL